MRRYELLEIAWESDSLDSQQEITAPCIEHLVDDRFPEHVERYGPYKVTVIKVSSDEQDIKAQIDAINDQYPEGRKLDGCEVREGK